MAMTLALIEGIVLCAAVCGTTFLFARPVLTDWTAVAAVLGQAFVVSLCGIVPFYYSDLYDRRTVRNFDQFASRLGQALGLAFILLTAFYMLFPDARIAEGPFASSLLIIVALLFPLRAVSDGVMGSHPFVRRALILGTSSLARMLIEEIQAQPHCRYAIVGVADDATARAERPFPHRLLGPLEHLGKIIEEVCPDRIIVAVDERRGRFPVSHLLEARARGSTVEDGIEVYERLTGKIAIESLTPSSLLFSRGFRKSRLDLTVGRGISLLASLVGLVGLAPVLGLIALAIKLESPGPVFFVQDRVGWGGRRFKLVKFRTMHPAAGPTSEWARDNGHRITRVGKYLRKFRLDELPNLVNILRGDMNLVGPRPHPASNFELLVMVARNTPECGEQIPYYSLRSMVRPGITGWAQVRYRYANDLEEEIEKMRYDLYYVKHMSLSLDLRILFETVKIILMGHGSGAPDASPNQGAHESEGVMTLRRRLEQERNVTELVEEMR